MPSADASTSASHGGGIVYAPMAWLHVRLIDPSVVRVFGSRNRSTRCDHASLGIDASR